jgi:MFS transporter, FHS family, L-fucose permease
MRLNTLPIFLAFFLMGLADAMGPMSEGVRKEYELSNVIATLLPFFVYIAFAVFSLPGGLLSARIGKKKLLLLGLGLNVVALLVPSMMLPSFPLLLGCIFILGIGTTFLQVAGNPIMRDVSPAGAYSRNLSFAQGIKGIGSTASTYILSAIGTLILFQNMGWRGAFPLFCVLMILAFISVALLKVEEAKVEKPPSLGSSLGLLKNSVFLPAVIGIFLYVGAESCMGRFLKPTLQSLGMDGEAAGKYGPTLFFLLLTIGRLTASAALEAFRRLGEVVGDAMANALALVDGIGVIGGGISAAWPLFLPTIVSELNSSYTNPQGGKFRRLASAAFNLEDPAQMESFLKGEAREIAIPRSRNKVMYDPLQRIGVGITRLGTSEAVAIGAYAFALNELDFHR